MHARSISTIFIAVSLVALGFNKYCSFPGVNRDFRKIFKKALVLSNLIKKMWKLEKFKVVNFLLFSFLKKQIKLVKNNLK